MKILKRNIGIDISKDSFNAAIVELTESFTIKVIANSKFKNNQEGFSLFLKWVKEHVKGEVKASFTMEATGVYYESLAYFLHGKKEVVHVVLPNKSKKYGESLEIKSKTDKIDAQILGRMGAERQLQKWNPSSRLFKALRCLTRERETLIHERTMAKNQLHALVHMEETNQNTIARFNERIEYLTKQVDNVDSDIENMVKSDKALNQNIGRILTIPGIGLITVSVLIAETNGFAAIKNIKQLTSYAGYDVRIRESGKWRGQAKISKKGNSHIRAALFFPACSASIYNEDLKEDYERLKGSKKVAMIANTAIQRKLLGLVYTIWKNNTIFDKAYVEKQKKSAK
jgi:transposase